MGRPLTFMRRPGVFGISKHTSVLTHSTSLAIFVARAMLSRKVLCV